MDFASLHPAVQLHCQCCPFEVFKLTELGFKAGKEEKYWILGTSKKMSFISSFLISDSRFFLPFPASGCHRCLDAPDFPTSFFCLSGWNCFTFIVFVDITDTTYCSLFLSGLSRFCFINYKKAFRKFCHALLNTIKCNGGRTTSSRRERFGFYPHVWLDHFTGCSASLAELKTIKRWCVTRASAQPCPLDRGP